MMRKLFRNIHLWLSLPLGLIISVICLSGASLVFERDITVRLRPGFFPFVEPGFEIDMECQVCGGKGCSVCKHVGWIEVMPGGSPHPNVLRAAGLDPDEYTGFYVNIGLDRLVMMRYGVDDVRLSGVVTPIRAIFVSPNCMIL